MDLWLWFGLFFVFDYFFGSYVFFFSFLCNDIKCISLCNRSTNLIHSWLTSRGKAKYMKWETIAGLLTGFSTSLISIGIFRILHQMNSCMPQISVVNERLQAVRTVHMKRACFLVLYFAAVGYFIIRYGKMLGILKVWCSAHTQASNHILFLLYHENSDHRSCHPDVSCLTSSKNTELWHPCLSACWIVWYGNIAANRKSELTTVARRLLSD